MALVGSLIVLSGLSILSLILSQLHKVVAIFEKPEPGVTGAGKSAGPSDGDKIDVAAGIDDRDLFLIDEATSAYEPLIEQLDQPFELKSLYALSEKSRFPHVHLTVKSLREAGRLVPQGEGLFAWHPQGAPEAEQPAPVPAAAPVAMAAAPPPQAIAAPAPAVDAPAAPAPAVPSEPVPPELDGTAVAAPMPGMIVRYEKQVGDAVSEGETVVILEAMKMENALPSPVSGAVKSISFASGDSVGKGDILCVIG